MTRFPERQTPPPARKACVSYHISGRGRKDFLICLGLRWNSIIYQKYFEAPGNRFDAEIQESDPYWHNAPLQSVRLALHCEQGFWVKGLQQSRILGLTKRTPFQWKPVVSIVVGLGCFCGIRGTFHPLYLLRQTDQSINQTGVHHQETQF